MYAASGGIIGQTIDMLNADTFCNLVVAGTPLFTSGQLRIVVQTADVTTSGDFTDPTSGIPAGSLPTSFASGTMLWLNSGQAGSGVLGGGVSGQNLQSGFMVGAGFQRPGRFVRANIVSGDFYAGTLTVGFISHRKTTGSGGGFTFNPTSGDVNV